MDNRVRVLHVITGMGSGGAEMFLMNIYRNMDHDKIVFDFLLQSDENLYKEELESYGSRIWQIPPYYRHPIQNRSELMKVLRHGYRIIHVHANPPAAPHQFSCGFHRLKAGFFIGSR